MKAKYTFFVNIHKSIPRFFSNVAESALKQEQNIRPSDKKFTHCYGSLYPWKNANEFSEYLTSCIVYNKGGLIALNKPYGIKIHGDDKPGTRSVNKQRFIIPAVSDCCYTLEDSLPALKKHLNLKSLSILKSAERYSSGIVLMSSSDNVSSKVRKSFNIAKFQKKPHLVHWAVTLGYSSVPYREEKVGIKFKEGDDLKFKLPVIETNLSKRACRLKLVHPVHVETRTISVNKTLGTSLVEVASTSVKFYFVKVYASSRIAPILGDLMYGSRMKTLLGIPVKVQQQSALAYELQSVPEKMSDALNLPRGEDGIKMIPTMLHLQRMILPNFEEKDKDLVITAEPPSQFQWTINKLNLIQTCK